MNLTIIFRLLSVPLLVLSNEASVVKTVPWEAAAGAVYIEYENRDGKMNGFRFFSHSAPASIRTTYASEYLDVRLHMSLMSGRLALFDRTDPNMLSKKVTFPVNVKRHLLYFWRVIPGGRVELGAYCDWKLVAHRVVPFTGLKLWTSSTRIGGRDLTPVEPTFPMRHHVGGIIHRFVVVGLK